MHVVHCTDVIYPETYAFISTIYGTCMYLDQYIFQNMSNDVNESTKDLSVRFIFDFYRGPEFHNEVGRRCHSDHGQQDVAAVHVRGVLH